MCGICGYISYDRNIQESIPILQKMCDLLVHRGPDDSGLYTKGNVGLGHRRLSIIDLSGGHQPMGNRDRSIWVVFNGEIYNFPELKKDLQQKGYVFSTSSDTEVLLQGYHAYGTEIVKKLNGMFAFAIWDEEKKRLFLARDRLGKKPLYYYPGKDRFLFSSELKSILADPAVPRDIHPEALDKFLSYSYVPPPLTIFKGIEKLRPGHFLVWENEQIKVQEYWDVHYQPPSDHIYSEKDSVELVDQLHDLLKAAVQRRLLSDVPLGAFLSGGIDSSLVVALMAEVCQKPVKTFTIGFDYEKYSEVNDARRIANHFHTEHHEFTVKPDSIIQLLPELVWHFDEPFADSSAIPTFYVSKMARKEVTVILSGDGGDELFAGYNRYLEDQKFAKYKSIPKFLRQNILGPIADQLPLHAKGKFFLKALSELEQDICIELFPPIKDYLYSGDFCAELEKYESSSSSIYFWKNIPNSRLSKMQYIDTKLYLPEDILMKVDRMSMANSLETRAPLLDYTIAEFATTVPESLRIKNGKGKYLLRQLAARLLPPEILKKKKHGFSIPKDEWFQGELKGFALDTLTSTQCKNRGYFHPKAVETIIHEHSKGYRDYSVWIWCLLNLELWHQTFVDRTTRRI